MKTVNFIILLLIVAGALNIGCEGLFGINPLAWVFGAFVLKIIYIAIGVAGVVGVIYILTGKRSL